MSPPPSAGIASAGNPVKAGKKKAARDGSRAAKKPLSDRSYWAGCVFHVTVAVHTFSCATTIV